MLSFSLDLDKLLSGERGDLPSATYLILECHDDCMLASFNDAADFSIHMGLPNRPDRRHTFRYQSLVDGLLALRELKKSHPSAGMWLSCEEILKEITGEDVVRGTVIARASVDPSDFDDEWRQFAAIIAWADAQGEPITLGTYADPIIQEVASLL